MANVITDKRWELKLKPIRKRPENRELLRLLPSWQNNTGPNDLGLIRFGFEMFPHILKREFGTAPWVRTAFSDVLYYEPGLKKIDRAHAICTFRDGSKSTWFAQMFPLYMTLVGQYGVYWNDNLLPETNYIRIRSKNQDEAEKRITNATSEFTQNEPLIHYFGNLEPTLKDVKDKKLKNQAKLLMLLNGYVWQAQGLNMPSRGALVRGKRPNLDINDDVENKENTKTPTQRQWNAKEVLSEQFGGLDHDGLSIYIGNYVHEDCLMKHLLKNPGWKPQYYQISYTDEDGKERSSWPARFSMKYIRNLLAWYSAHEELGGKKMARMEYWNEIISDDGYETKYVDGRYVRKQGMNFIELLNEDKTTTLLRCYIVVSGDPAISKDKKSSFPAITVTAFASDGNRYVIDCLRKKLDLRDRYFDERNDRAKVDVIARTPEQLGLVQSRGMVEEMARRILNFHADGFALENAGQQLAWYNDLVISILDPLGIKIDKFWYNPKDEKTYKLRMYLLNWFSAGKYFFFRNAPFIQELDKEVVTFPDNKKDLLDALHNAERLGAGHLPKETTFTASGHIKVFGQEEENDYVAPPGVEPFILF